MIYEVTNNPFIFNKNVSCIKIVGERNLDNFLLSEDNSEKYVMFADYYRDDDKIFVLVRQDAFDTMFEDYIEEELV